MTTSSNVNRPLLALALLACLGADEFRPAPKFAGKSIPDPPAQKEAWTPPESRLPRFLVAATAALFEQGMADPRGCEYRDVEIGNGGVVKTRGFVLPGRPGEPGRFVVSWDGVIYPAFSVGPAADLDGDVRTLAEAMRRDREAVAARGADSRGNAGGFAVNNYGGMPWGGGGPSGVDDRSPLKLCLLLRLGRADLAEALFAAGTTWSPEAKGRDLTDYQISYVSLAEKWAGVVYVRLVDAHMRADDAIALDAARRLSAFAKSVEAKADAMGFPRVRPGQPVRNGRPTYFSFLGQLADLLADHERRAQQPPRGPIPRRGGDPSARIAALIRDLDQIDEQQMMSPGMAQPGNSPLVGALIAEGDPAVGPLLDALASDARLTRSVSYGRGGSIERFVAPARDAVFAALVGILKTNDFSGARYGMRDLDLAGRKALAQSMRAFWEKNRAVPLVERWYAALRDDSAGQARWSEAASGVVQTGDDPRARKGSGPMKGESLRGRRDPSVTELLARRVADIAGRSNPLQMPDIELHQACRMATILNTWDPEAARPVLRDLMRRCVAGIDERRERGIQPDQGISGYMADFALIRARAGDPEALDEYAAWVRRAEPNDLEHQSIGCFEPLWTYRDHPAIANAARLLFADPNSPWVALLRDPQGRAGTYFYNTNLYTSPLLCVPAFREGVIAAMGDKAEIGTARRGDQGTVLYNLKSGGSGGYSGDVSANDEIGAGVEIPYRVCDDIARQFSSLEGLPSFGLLWPEARRDRAIADYVSFLKRFGDRFSPDPPGGVKDFPGPRAHLKFPPLGRVATPDDVRRDLAIFSLAGEGEVRLAPVPAMPIRAKWTTLKDTPVDRRYNNGPIVREYDQEGWVWQAEEVRKGETWERSYGFVGHHVVARAPAAEVEFIDDPYRWSPLTGGLDARVEPIDPPSTPREPGRPVVVALRLRNRLGVDGRPALRRGVALKVSYLAPAVPGAGRFRQDRAEELKPRSDASFVPGDAARVLTPLESFEAFRVDLNDRFDLTRPGFYTAFVTFEADSGVGAGTSNPYAFTIGDVDRGP